MTDNTMRAAALKCSVCRGRGKVDDPPWGVTTCYDCNGSGRPDYADISAALAAARTEGFKAGMAEAASICRAIYEEGEDDEAKTAVDSCIAEIVIRAEIGKEAT